MENEIRKLNPQVFRIHLNERNELLHHIFHSREKPIEWVHLEGAHHANLLWLKEQKLIPDWGMKIFFLEDVRPRSILTKEGTLLILKTINFNPPFDYEDMISLRIWIQENRIVTLSDQKVKTIETLKNDLENNCGPTNLVEMILNFITSIHENIEFVLDEIEDEIEKAEDLFNTQKKYKSLQISQMRSRITLLLRNFIPQKKAFDVLPKSFFFQLNGEQIGYYNDLLDQLIRFTEDLTSFQKRAEIISDEIRISVSEKLNKNMYVISIISTIFLPLTFITSSLGVNLAGIPGAQHPHAFFYLLGGMLILTIVQVVAVFFIKSFRQKIYV